MSPFLTAVLRSTVSSSQACLLTFLSPVLDLGVCHTWTRPLRSQAPECFVGASFREEEGKPWRFVASPCYNLAHLPVPTRLVS